MKKITLLTLVLSGISAFSQTEQLTQIYVNQQEQEIKVISPSSFSLSKPLREIAKEEKNKSNTLEGIREIENHFKKNKVVNANALPNGDDPIWQKNSGNNKLGVPLINFEGLPGANPASGVPLDPSGAASANYYVQAINTEYKVFDKNGSTVTTVANLSSLWAGSVDDGDPIVMYDKHADRWFISQFQHSTGVFKLLVAISQTNDPTGSYYTYSYTMTVLPDYPKYSIWWDGYYFSINSSQGTSGVMDRNKMLAGDPTATMQILTAPSYATNGFTSLLPTDADGSLPPNGSPCYFFNLQDDAWGNGADGIRVYKMTTDWATPSNTSIVSDGLITTSAFDTNFPIGPGGYQQISQKGTTDKVDAVAEVLYYRAQHRVWSGYNSVVLCHVVDVNGSDRGGLRWYELRQTGTGSWSLYQEGTYAPTTDTDNRWMGSIAMDDQGNIAMAYSASGPNTYPSIRYTGRKPSDPLGQMSFIEETAFTGLGSQTAATAGDRYGDYSHLSLDPDGQTFWHTTEYVAADGFPRTRIYSFKLATSIGIKDNPYYNNLDTKIATNLGNVTINVKGLKNNKSLILDVFDISGKLITHYNVTPSNKQFTKVINTTFLSKGIYMIRFGNINFQVVEKIAISN